MKHEETETTLPNGTIMVSHPSEPLPWLISPDRKFRFEPDKHGVCIGFICSNTNGHTILFVQADSTVKRCQKKPVSRQLAVFLVVAVRFYAEHCANSLNAHTNG